MSKDAERTSRFLTELFGWSLDERHMGAHGTYRMLMQGDRGLGGIVPLEHAPPEVPSHWIAYVAVDDCAATRERAQAAGARSASRP